MALVAQKLKMVPEWPFEFVCVASFNFWRSVNFQPAVKFCFGELFICLMKVVNASGCLSQPNVLVQAFNASTVGEPGLTVLCCMFM